MAECPATMTGEHSFRWRTKGSRLLATRDGLILNPHPPERSVECICGVAGGRVEEEQLKEYGREQRAQTEKAKQLMQEEQGASQLTLDL